MKRKKKPVTVQRGSVFVKIYSRRKQDRTYFQLSDYSEGRRRLRSFASLKKAKKEATNVAKKISLGEAAALSLTNKDRAAYVRARQNLRPTGVPLEIATLHYAEAFKILGGDKLIEAAKFFASRGMGKLARKTVQDVVKEFLAAKRQRSKSTEESRGLSNRYIQDLKYRCNKFAGRFHCQISSITAPQIEDFFRGLKLSARSYINFRRVVNSLFEFAKRRGYLAKDHDEMSRVEKISDHGIGSISVYTPQEMARLLRAADQDFLPVLAIGGFAGLRSSELERVNWSDVDLGRRIIVIRGARKRGTPSRRIVPITDNLASWLSPYAKMEGKVWPHGHDDFYDVQQETAAATATGDAPALKWKVNALRHSFISYRVADVQNVNQVALESGNSATVIFAHYKELVSPAVAKLWFELAPLN